MMWCNSVACGMHLKKPQLNFGTLNMISVPSILRLKRASQRYFALQQKFFKGFKSSQMALWAPWGLSPALVIIINKNVVWNSFQHPKSSSKASLKSSNLLVTCSPYPYGLFVAPLFIDSNVRPSLIFWAILLAFGPHELLFLRFSCSFEALQVGPFGLL